MSTTPSPHEDVGSRKAREERAYVIVFLDLSVFARDAARRTELEIADIIDSYYERVAERTNAAGGTVVKFIGDGALLAFPTERADDAVDALLGLRAEIDRWLAEAGWLSRLMVKAHAGTVIAGDYGARGAKRFDVIGNVVNVAARLPRPFHVTPQVFRLLSSEGRTRLKKHTPPITYIPIDDPHV
jgi:adenylate cyclase